jgi:predicted dehydrogenase
MRVSHAVGRRFENSVPDRFRVGIIGAGRIAGLNAGASDNTTHAGAMVTNGRFEIGGICDIDPDRASALASQWGGQTFARVSDLLERVKPDAVVISTPDGTHAAIAREILDSSAPPRLLIIEKPPGVSRQELQALMSRAAAVAGTRTVVNLSRRFDERHRALARLIADASFGQLVEATFTYYGGWLHNGIHAVDTLRLLLGGELRVVSSRIGAPGRPGDPCRDVDVAWSFGPDARIAFRGFDEAAFQLFELELRFSEGRVRVEDFGHRMCTERVRVSRGERELHRTEELQTDGSALPMSALYRDSASFLAGDEAALNHAAIATVMPTMEILFDAA